MLREQGAATEGRHLMIWRSWCVATDLTGAARRSYQLPIIKAHDNEQARTGKVLLLRQHYTAVHASCCLQERPELL
jgi:hypothetical protein